MTPYDVIIVGGGPAGCTAGLYAARSGLRTLILDKGLTAGSLGMASKIANYPGVEGELSGVDLVKRMRRQAGAAGAELLQSRALGSLLEDDVKQVQSSAGIHMGRAVIVATGSMGRAAGIPGEERLLGRGVSYCARCDGAFFRESDVAVAGNTDEAVEEALFLTRFAARVHVLCPTAEFQADAGLTKELLESERVTVHRSTRVLEIMGDQAVVGVRVREGSRGQRDIPVAGAFLYLQGRLPITEFLGDQVSLSPSGCVEVDGDLQTRVPGVFAAGDVLCNHVKQVIIAAAEGARAAIAADRYLSGRETLRADWE